MNQLANALIERQCAQWPLAADNYAALSHVQLRTVCADPAQGVVRAQYNPARVTSSTAAVDARSLAARPCFLCSVNRPPQQEAITLLEGRYELLVNPFPIFPRHLTLARSCHVPQLIEDSLIDMLTMTRLLDQYVLFYNGARCGASAPDHAHFQAGNKGFLPIEEELPSLRAEALVEAVLLGARRYTIAQRYRRAVVIEGQDPAALQQLFADYMSAHSVGGEEPMINLLAWHQAGSYTLVLFPRNRHRPACYYACGDDQLLISPASVDLGGVFIFPRFEDFQRITPSDIYQIMNEI